MEMSNTVAFSVDIATPDRDISKRGAGRNFRYAALKFYTTSRGVVACG